MTLSKIDVPSDAVNSALLAVKPVEAGFVGDENDDQDAPGHVQGQAEDVDESEGLVSSDVSQAMVG